MKMSKYTLVYGLLSISLLILAGCKSETTNYPSNESTSTSTTATIAPIPSVDAASVPQKNEESITKEDETAVHELIAAHFKAIENKDFSAAWEMFSSEMKSGSSKNDVIQNHFGIESLKLISIQTYLRPQEPKENGKKPTIHFVVKLDIVPNSFGAWGKGMNERFVGVVKEQGQWKIRALATSP